MCHPLCSPFIELVKKIENLPLIDLLDSLQEKTGWSTKHEFLSGSPNLDGGKCSRESRRYACVSVYCVHVPQFHSRVT